MKISYTPLAEQPVAASFDIKLDQTDQTVHQLDTSSVVGFARAIEAALVKETP